MPSQKGHHHPSIHPSTSSNMYNNTTQKINSEKSVFAQKKKKIIHMIACNGALWLFRVYYKSIFFILLCIVNENAWECDRTLEISSNYLFFVRGVMVNSFRTDHIYTHYFSRARRKKNLYRKITHSLAAQGSCKFEQKIVNSSRRVAPVMRCCYIILKKRNAFIYGIGVCAEIKRKRRKICARGSFANIILLFIL